MKMEIKDMKGIIKIINVKAKEYIIIKMEINIMKEILKMINLREKE